MTYTDNAKQPKWTKQDENLLHQLFGSMSIGELSNKLGRSSNAIYLKANQLGLRKTATWTKDQLDFLRQHYASATAEELRTEFGHPLCSVIKKAEQLRLRRPWKWTNDELELLNQLVGKGLSDQEMAVELGRPVTTVAARRRKSGTLLKNRWTEAEDNAIGKRAAQLGLAKLEVWSEPMEQLLQRQYPTSTIPELLALFPGKTRRQVKRRAQQLGLRKDLVTLARCFHTELGKVPKMPGQWARWRNTVLKRDGFRCQECGCVKDRLLLRAHHIVPRHDPECAKYDPDNGICLCVDCHDYIKGCEYEVKDRYLAIATRNREVS